MATLRGHGTSDETALVEQQEETANLYFERFRLGRRLALPKFRTLRRPCLREPFLTYFLQIFIEYPSL
jgi:hypothetical protein